MALEPPTVATYTVFTELPGGQIAELDLEAADEEAARALALAALPGADVVAAMECAR